MTADIRQLTDFVLLNACTTDSSGLYRGKAGMSLCLFEIARLYNDECLEDKAFELLQEALLCRKEDIDFGNGLSGIGFVSAYLIDNQMLEADYEEMFGEQTKHILTVVDDLVNNNAEMQIISILFFLAQVNQYIDCEIIIKLLINKLETSLQTMLAGAENKKTVNIITVELFQFYLRITHILTLKASESLVGDYCRLYQKGYFISNYGTGYYLNLHNADDAVVVSNKDVALQGICPNALSLAQKINLSYLMNVGGCEDSTILTLKGADLEHNIVRSIPENTVLAGYEAGVARLLLYHVFLHDKAIGKDVSRFRYLL